MKTYTVVGVYSDNMQVYVTSVDAKNPVSASEKVRDEIYGGYILSVFEGEHQDLHGEDEMMTS